MKTFIWDVDGTLMNSYPVMISSLIESYQKKGVVLTKEEVEKYVITYSITSYFKKLEEETGIEYASIKEDYQQLNELKNDKISTCSHVKETLRLLKDSGAVHFIYTHRGASTEFLLKNNGILDFFEEVVTSDYHFLRKPAADGVNYLVEKYHLDKNETYYVGDRTIDMDCAKNAGVKGILYLEKGSVCQPNGSENYIVSDLLEIVNL